MKSLVSRRRKILAWSGLFLFGMLGVHALVNSISAVIAIAPERVMTSFTDESVGRDERQQAIGLLSVSHKLSLGNPLYLESATTLKLIDAGWFGDANTGELAEVNDDYLGILKHRPIWPYTWINYLRASAQSGLFDKDFDQSFAHTLVLVGHNNELQLKLLQVGLEFWFDVSADARHTMSRAIERLDETNIAAMKKMLQRLGLTFFVCASLNAGAYERVCV